MPKIAETTSGVKTLVTNADINQRVVITDMHLQIHGEDGTKNVKFSSDSTDLTGLLAYSFVLPDHPGRDGWYQCEPGQSFKMTLSGTFTVGGHFNYRLEPHGA